MIYLFLDYLVGPKENPGKKKERKSWEGYLRKRVKKDRKDEIKQ